LTETLADPGVQGAAITGRQGWGVRTFCAVAVAAATCGLESDMHMPKGGMLAEPISVTTPVGVGLLTAWPLAAKVAGVVPIEHCSVAPVHTRLGMRAPSVGLPAILDGARPWREREAAR
jgi:hypothetical protein